MSFSQIHFNDVAWFWHFLMISIILRVTLDIFHLPGDEWISNFPYLKISYLSLNFVKAYIGGGGQWKNSAIIYRCSKRNTLTPPPYHPLCKFFVYLILIFLLCHVHFFLIFLNQGLIQIFNKTCLVLFV